MKSIEIDDDLYAFIASQTRHIGESASQILRRLLLEDSVTNSAESESEQPKETLTEASDKPVDVKDSKPATPKKVTRARQSASQITPASAKQVDEATDHNKDDIVNMVSVDALSTFTKRVDQFIFILSAAHKLNSDNFALVESIVGKNRTYFATSKEALLENGSSTNPKAIPDSPFWVVTNNNTAKKVNMLEQVLRTLGYKPDVVDTVVSRFAPEGK